MAEILDTFLSEFECPICFDYVSPPINQCAVGHLICNVCFDKIEKCPTCRGPKGAHRAYLLEDLHTKLTFPCKHLDEGCRFMDRGEQINKHQAECIFSSRRCPLSAVVQCNWSSSVDKIFKHCEQAHMQFVRKGSKQSFVIKNFNQIAEKTAFFNIIQAHGEVFNLCVCVFPDGHLRWRLILIGLEDDLERYDCKVNVGTSGEHMLLASSIDVPTQDLFENKSCIITPVENARKLCGFDSDFHYDVRIIDRGFELFLNEVMNLK